MTGKRSGACAKWSSECADSARSKTGSTACSTRRATQTLQFDIKPQPLASALNAFALQSHQQILFTPDAKGKTTQGVHGALTPEAALKQKPLIEAQRHFPGAPVS